MEIYNEQMERMENPDLCLGWLEDSVRRVAHEAVPAVREVWHYETIAEYPNGGSDVTRVVDVPGTEAMEAWVESIPIQIYHPYTQEELDAMEAEKTRPTPAERLEKLEDAMRNLTDTLAQMETQMRAVTAWLSKKS
ncbi:MAG: hypothetical protein ACI4MM_01785 [Candidatus Ventricola sp.]